MMFKADPYPIGPFVKGMNNRLPSIALGNDRLRNAVNVDIDSTGHLRRRQGAGKVVQGTAVRSIWFDGENGPGYFADGAALKTFNPVGLPPYQAFQIATVTAGGKIAFCQHAGSVFWTDGVTGGQIISGVNQTWGIAPPTSIPTLQETTGSLNDGTYQVTYTYVRANGEESGASIGAQITISHSNRHLDGTAGLNVGNIFASPDPSVTAINVYCTAPNATVPMRVLTMPNLGGGDGAVYVADSFAQALATQFFTQPPAGSIVFSHGARVWVVSGSFLFYSEAFAPGWFSPAFNFLPMPGPVGVALPVEDGVFVGTDQGQFFLPGMDPEKMSIKKVLPYGVVPGTGVTVLNDKKVAWVTPRGIVIGTSGGVVKAVQEDEIAVELAAAGILGYREVNGLRHLVAILTGTQPVGMAHKDYNEQETRRQSTELPLG